MEHEDVGCFYLCTKSCCTAFNKRYVVAVLASLGLLMAYFQRSCLQLVLADLVTQEASEETAIAGNHKCLLQFNDSFRYEDKGSYNWTESEKGSVNAAFFFGYILSQVPGALAVSAIGSKSIFSGSIVLSSLCSLLTPIAIRSGVWPLACLRTFMGLTQGPLFPILGALTVNWTPREERPLLSAIIYTGLPLGLFLGSIVPSLLVLLELAWEWVFYISAGGGLLWYILWQMYAFSSPVEHPFIGPRELVYIVRTVAYDTKAFSITLKSDLYKSYIQQNYVHVPWRSIFSSTNMMILFLASFGFDWAFNMMSIEFPFYLSGTLRLPLIKSGTMSCTPWLCMSFGTLLYGGISQIFVDQRIFKTIYIRKSLGLISSQIPPLCIVLATYCGCAYVLASVFFATSMFYAGAVFSCHKLSVTDLSPAYSAIAMGLVNLVGSMTGILVPILVHSNITQGGTLHEWSKCFYIAAGVIFILTLPYVFLIKAERRYWSK